MPQDEHSAGVGVGPRVVERKVEAGPGPGQGERDAVGGQGTFGVRECGDQGQCVASGAGPSAVENFPLAGTLEEFVRTGEEVGRVHVQAAGEVEQYMDGQIGKFFEVDLVLVDAEEVGELPGGHTGGEQAAFEDVILLGGAVPATSGALAAGAGAETGVVADHRRLRMSSLRGTRSSPRWCIHPAC